MPSSLSRGRSLALAALLLAASCTGDQRYRVVEGPARLSLGGTTFSPPVLVEIDEGGRAFFGPTWESSCGVPTPGAPREGGGGTDGALDPPP